MSTFLWSISHVALIYDATDIIISLIRTDSPTAQLHDVTDVITWLFRSDIHGASLHDVIRFGCHVMHSCWSVGCCSSTVQGNVKKYALVFEG